MSLASKRDDAVGGACSSSSLSLLLATAAPLPSPLPSLEDGLPPDGGVEEGEEAAALAARLIAVAFLRSARCCLSW